MSMSSCNAGRTSPGGLRSIRPRVNRSTSAPAIRTALDQRLPMPRKPFLVNETVRDKVRHLAGVGVRQDDIARIIGCAPKTLRKRCRDDLDRGVAEANAMVSGSLFAAAKGGNVVAQIFWLKTRAHWRERAPHSDAASGSDAGGNPPVVLVLPDNSRDPELTHMLQDANQDLLPESTDRDR